MKTEVETTIQDLHFEALDRCDGCGTSLPPARQLAGLCEACLPPRPVHTSARRRLRGKEDRRGE
jgi:predicted amidophosphoribosyltransferase